MPTHPSRPLLRLTPLAWALLSVACQPDPPPTSEPAGEAPTATASEADPQRLVLTGAAGGSRAWTVPELEAALPGKRAVIEVDSPVYHRHMRYEGFWLSDVLAAAGPPERWRGILAFQCADGFTPTLPAAEVGPLKLFLAVGEPDLPGGARWTRLKGLSPAPFYVVSPLPGSYRRLPWPFQLEAIRIVDFAEAHPGAWPRGAAADSAVMRGFERFRTTCFGCHSINLEGGIIGPELNTPRSVTEYWQRPMLTQFLLDPASVRARTKMPNLGLSPTDIAELLAYLDHMRGLRQASDAGQGDGAP